MTAYKEPSGPGIRVDSCAYQGYAPPPQFDPLFAKLIVASNSSETYHSASQRALSALDEYLVIGTPTKHRSTSFEKQTSML